MKLTIPKHDLAHALRRVQGAVSGRSSIPALGCVLLRATDKLKVMATNLDLQISHTTWAHVIEPGSVLLPISSFNQFVTQFGPQDVELSVDEKFKCSLVCGDSRGSLSGMDPKEFVEFPAQERKGFTMAQADLKAALRKTLIAIASDDPRIVLTGLSIELKANRLTLVGCDAKHLALSKQLLDGDGIAVVVQGNGAKEASRLLSENGDVTVSVGQDNVEFAIGDTVLTAKLIVSPYVAYRDYLPKKFEHRIALNRDEFLSAVKYVGWITEPNRLPIMLVEIENNTLSVYQRSSTNEARRTLAVKYDGPAAKIKLPPEQVTAILSNLTEDEVVLEIIDDLAPVSIKAGNFMSIVMALRPM